MAAKCWKGIESSGQGFKEESKMSILVNGTEGKEARRREGKVARREEGGSKFRIDGLKWAECI